MSLAINTLCSAKSVPQSLNAAKIRTTKNPPRRAGFLAGAVEKIRTKLFL
jgi:hypothetical protein